MTPLLSRWIPVGLTVALALSCAPKAGAPVRLGGRIACPQGDFTLDLGEARTADLRTPLTLQIARQAADFRGLALRLRGTAKAVSVNWRRAGEHGFVAGRRLTVPFAPDDAGEPFEIDLSHEEQWVGDVATLQVSATGGPAALDSVVLLRVASAVRSVSLRGETRPALAGRERYEIPLAGELPRRAALETALGVLPEFQRLGARACFTIAIAGPSAAAEPVLDRCLASDPSVVLGWTPIRLDVTVPAGGRLVLESKTEVDGRPVGAATVWGEPVLLPRRPQSGPNLLLVVVDTLRADALGAYGSPAGLTPELDALAKRSVRLAALHSPAPWTLPSMGSLMTGLQPQTHGGGRPMGAEMPAPVADGAVTLAERLAAQGFYTTAVYKNIYLNPEFGLERGFDRYASYEAMPASDGAERESNAGFLVDRAIDELDRVKDRRFFLYVHLFDPHNPYEAPREWCQRIAAPRLGVALDDAGCRVDRRPEGPMPESTDFPRIRALYDAEVAYTDHEVGRLLAAVRGRGLDDDTVIVFASDHGEEFYERADRERALGYEANSDHGHTLYEELLHVPALIAAPGLASGVVEEPVQTVDLFATMLGLLGVQAPTNAGEDLSRVLAGAGSGKLDRPRPTLRPLVANVILHGAPRQSVRSGPWKMIVGAPGEVELYQLVDDPGETRNLAASRPEIVASLRQLLVGELQTRRYLRRVLLPANGGRAVVLDWSHITKLRSLGYLH